MIKANLADLADRPSGTTAILPPIQERLQTRRAYQVELRKVLRGLAREVRETVIPALSQDRRLNADSETFFITLEEEAERLEAQALAAATILFRRESQAHTRRFIASVRSAVGVDLTAVILNEDLAQYLSDQATRNASLIKSLSQETINNIRQIVLNAKLNGTSITQVREELKRRFDISNRRATLIAFDQTAKLTSDLNRIRQEQAGVTSYRWLTAADERVRDLHRGLDGTVYEWDEATGAEGGARPGQPVRCRCVARGIVEF